MWPEARGQRDWVHKVANVLDALPKSIQPTAKKMLAEIRDAEDRDHAVAAAKRFDAEFRAKWPKAADKIRSDLDQLLTFCDFAAEHWLHLKTSNPIESTFSTVRLRTKVKGPGSRAAGLAMAYKLIESAQRPVASGQRPAPRRPRTRRCRLQEGSVDRKPTHRGPGRRVINGHNRSTTIDYASQIWRVSVMASGSIGLIREGEQQDNRHRDRKQAAGRYEVTNGRGTAIHDTTDRVEERQATKRTDGHERKQRPPPRPGPLHEQANPEHTCPTSSKGDADDERRDDNGFQSIPGASVERDPERRDADPGGQERQPRGQHRSPSRNPSHATQIARCGGSCPSARPRRTLQREIGRSALLVMRSPLLDSASKLGRELLNEAALASSDALRHGVGGEDQYVSGLAVQREIAPVGVDGDDPVELGELGHVLSESDADSVDEGIDVDSRRVVIEPTRDHTIERGEWR